MSKYKIWFQGATDRVHMAPYISKVEAHLKAILEPDFSATFHTTTPPATTTHAVTEFRIARNLIRNAVEAERQGYAAMAITHFQDAGLAEVKQVDNMLMAQTGGIPGFTAKALPVVRLGSGFGGQDFQGHLPAERLLVGQPQGVVLQFRKAHVATLGWIGRAEFDVRVVIRHFGAL